MVMYMLVKQDRERAIELFKEGRATDLLTYVPQVAYEIVVNVAFSSP